jgi:ATP-binding cassette, subfamily B, bacterial MsbA
MKQPEPKRRPAPTGFSFDALLESDHSRRAVFVRLLRECLLPHWRIVSISVAAMITGAATAGVLPFLLQRVGDDVFVHKDAVLVYVLPALIALAVAVRALSDWVSTVAEGSLATKIVADLRIRMFDTLAAADLAWIQRVHSGRFVSTFVTDTATIDRAATRVMVGLFQNGASVIFLMGAMFCMDWRLSVVVLLGTPVAVLNLGRQRKRIRRAAGRSLSVAGDLNSALTQTLQSMRVVKAYGQERNEARRLHHIITNIRKFLMKTTRTRAAVGPLWQTLTGFGLAAGVFYGGWEGIYGDVTLGAFMGFMTAALLTFQPMKALASIQATLSEGLLAAERVFALIDYAPHVTEARGAPPLKVSAGAVSFKDVDFAYEGGGPVLSGFNLELPAGRKLALVGPSGAGKSTVLNLILRFFDPASGSVRIDGQDLRDVTIASVRAASALLTQDPVLFDDTIAANIAYGSEGAGAEEIAAVASAAAAHDFIMKLPEGYQTRVGEAGNRLSGGERQRIAFARAMLRNTPILLLDEPTSALDAESEAKVQRAMQRLLSGRTVIMIAHRLSTVQSADQIFYMEGGRVLESGTHSELVARRGKYARMVQTQLLGDEPQRASAGG